MKSIETNWKKLVGGAVAALMFLSIVCLAPLAVAFAEETGSSVAGSGSGPSSTTSSSSESEPNFSGGSLYIAGYSVVDDLGNAILYLTPDTHCKIVFLMVDGRIEDTQVPQGTDPVSYTHLRATAL